MVTVEWFESLFDAVERREEMLGVGALLRCPPAEPRGSLGRGLIHSRPVLSMAAARSTFTVTAGGMSCQLCRLEAVSLECSLDDATSCA